MCVLRSSFASVFVLSHVLLFFFFFKQKTAYEMRISDWSSDVCSSDLPHRGVGSVVDHHPAQRRDLRGVLAHLPRRAERAEGRRVPTAGPAVPAQDRKSVV